MTVTFEIEAMAESFTEKLDRCNYIKVETKEEVKAGTYFVSGNNVTFM